MVHPACRASSLVFMKRNILPSFEDSPSSVTSSIGHKNRPPLRGSSPFLTEHSYKRFLYRLRKTCPCNHDHCTNLYHALNTHQPSIRHVGWNDVLMLVDGVVNKSGVKAVLPVPVMKVTIPSSSL